VHANGLCSRESDTEDASSWPILNPQFEIHDFDACGVVRTEPRRHNRRTDRRKP
jgi:hypothetical protein